MLSHGVGPHYDGDHLIDEALERIERTLRHGRSLTLAERVVVSRAHDAVAPRPPIAGRLQRWPARAFRKSFRVPNNEAFAGIRINLEGREPRGRIRPGVELDAYCAALDARAAAAAQRRHGRSGVPARRTLRPALPGLEARLLPDLLAEWSRDAEIRALASPTIGRIEGRYAGVRTGDHRPQGLFLAAGPGLTPKRVETPRLGDGLRPDDRCLAGRRARGRRRGADSRAARRLALSLREPVGCLAGR